MAKLGNSKRNASAKKAAKTTRAPTSAPPPARTVTPYLAIDGAADAIEWYKHAFGAKEITRQPAPGGRIMHAEIRVGDSSVYVSDIFPGSDMQDPRRGAPSVNLHVWTKNAEKLWASAVGAGAKVTMPLANQFWGVQYGRLLDPFGHSWALSWRSKLSKAELGKLREEAKKGMAGPA